MFGRWPLLAAFGRFLARFGQFWPFLAICGRFGQFTHGRFWPVFAVLAAFGRFWPLFGRSCGPATRGRAERAAPLQAGRGSLAQEKVTWCRWPISCKCLTAFRRAVPGLTRNSTERSTRRPALAGPVARVFSASLPLPSEGVFPAGSAPKNLPFPYGERLCLSCQRRPRAGWQQSVGCASA